MFLLGAIRRADDAILKSDWIECARSFDGLFPHRLNNSLGDAVHFQSSLDDVDETTFLWQENFVSVRSRSYPNEVSTPLCELVAQKLDAVFVVVGGRIAELQERVAGFSSNLIRIETDQRISFGKIEYFDTNNRLYFANFDSTRNCYTDGLCFQPLSAIKSLTEHGTNDA